MKTTPHTLAKSPARKKRGSVAAQPSRSMGDQIYERLKNDIILCKFKPGEELTELGLATAYELGRAPVRAALARLCQDRLLVVMPRRGHVVAPITIQSIQDVFRLRLILEPAAARMALGHIDMDLLRSFSAAPGPPNDRDRNLKFLADNRGFHLAIISACNNERLERMIAELYDETSRMLHLGLYAERDSDRMRVDHQDQEKQHEAIIEAFAAGDPDAIEQAVRSHIESSHSLVMKAILSGRLAFPL